MNATGRRLLITGGSSYLGRHLLRLAADNHAADALAYTSFSHDPLQTLPGIAYRAALDLRDAAAVRHCLDSFQPAAVIHTAGSNRSPDMEQVIVEGTRHLVEATAANNTRLIHLSTDSIFDGTAAPYDETAAPTPINAYGRAKATAEAIVRDHPNHVIVRTSLIYGLEEMDIGTSWMVEALHAGRPVTLFTNQVRNPIWVESLSQACLELTQPGSVGYRYIGILNVAGRQVLTRAEFALRLLDWWGITERETLTTGLAEGGRWPLDCRLTLDRANSLLKTSLHGVDNVLTNLRLP